MQHTFHTTTGLVPAPHSVPACAGCVQVAAGLPAQPAAPHLHLRHLRHLQVLPAPRQPLQQDHTGGLSLCCLF